MAQELIVVVTGSTGKQGSAVARGLLERGHEVRAVIGDLASEAFLFEGRKSTGKLVLVP